MSLISGKTLAAAAVELGIALSTARTHLRRAFDQTGTTRQAELLAVVLRSPAGLLDIPRGSCS